VTKTFSASSSCDNPFLVRNSRIISLVFINLSPQKYCNTKHQNEQATRCCGAGSDILYFATIWGTL
ncbi:MAG: hypothetical protein IKU41_04985, partial [Clostridia bacterium]|nr:hypothetical protein [Clostridia bacterium]